MGRVAVLAAGSVEARATDVQLPASVVELRGSLKGRRSDPTIAQCISCGRATCSERQVQTTSYEYMVGASAGLSGTMSDVQDEVGAQYTPIYYHWWLQVLTITISTSTRW